MTKQTMHIASFLRRSLSGVLRNGRGASLLCCALAVGMMTGCNFRPLLDTDYNTLVRVVVNTDSINNVTQNIYNPDIPAPVIEPEVYRVLFYSTRNNRLVAESFISDRSTDENGRLVISGNVALIPGTYRMLAYDFGTESTIISDHTEYGKVKAGVSTVNESILSRYKSKSGYSEEEIVVYEPDHLMVGRVNEETIPYRQEVHIIETESRTVVETYYLQIKVEGLQYLSSAYAFLSGMESGNYIAADERISDPRNTVYFTLYKGADHDGADVICTVFNTFGRVPDSTNGLTVTFDLRTTDGRTIMREFDISDVFLTEDAIERNWLFIEDTLTIDPPPHQDTGSGGFDPSVEDWDDEENDIYI